MLIKWTNRVSGEQGFVKDIRIFRQYFESTKNINEAYIFANTHMCNTALKLLNEFGETKQNRFELV